MSGSWWRRNALALAALPAISAAFLVASGVDQALAPASSSPDTIVVTDRDALVPFAGTELTRFRSGSMGEAEAAPLRVPQNAHVVAVTFHGEVPAGTAEEDVHRCSGMTLTELTGEQRRFVSAELVLNWDMGGYVTDCQVPYDSAEPVFEAFIPFIVPEDSRGPYLFSMTDPYIDADLVVTVQADWLEPSED